MLKCKRRILRALLMTVFPFVCVTDARSTARGYEEIDGEMANALMESESGYILLDTRTQAEYDERHIEGAIMIPEYEIAARAQSELPDKNQLILIYCRSGRRSKIAAQVLVMLGYTNIKEFGGIIDWKYESKIVTSSKAESSKAVNEERDDV